MRSCRVLVQHGAVDADVFPIQLHNYTQPYEARQKADPPGSYESYHSSQKWELLFTENSSTEVKESALLQVSANTSVDIRTDHERNDLV